MAATSTKTREAKKAAQEARRKALLEAQGIKNSDPAETPSTETTIDLGPDPDDDLDLNPL